MQTFLPYADFAASAKALDYKRLGKQRVEVKQLLLALGNPVGEHRPKSSSWVNHPAARMWMHHQPALASYGIAICEEWRARKYNDTLLAQFHAVLASNPIVLPPWLGDIEFHRRHQSNLIRKDWDYYAHQFPNVPDNLEYIWPN